MSTTFADYCKTLTVADLRDLDVHPGCAGTALEEVLAEADGVAGVHAAGWLREALMLRWMTARAEAAEDALRSLASYVGNGGYNAPTVDAKEFRLKIVDGIDTLVSVETKRRDTLGLKYETACGTIRTMQSERDALMARIRGQAAERDEWKTRAEAAEREAGWRRCAMEQSTDCAGCGKHKHTPARMDSEFGGYVCAGCMEARIHELRAIAEKAAQPAAGGAR